MHYEMLSRALAFASCLSTVSLFATSMALAAINMSNMKPQPCGPTACAATAAKPSDPLAAFTDRAHIERVAAVLWLKKI